MDLNLFIAHFIYISLFFSIGFVAGRINLKSLISKSLNKFFKRNN